MLRSIEKKVKKNPGLKVDYDKQIEDMIERKVARKLTAKELENYDVQAIF